MTNTLSSMTGFARDDAHFEGETLDATWAWEARSLNGRGLDVRLRMPAQFESLEGLIRKKMAAHFSRGSLTLSLQYRSDHKGGEFRVNEPALHAAIEAIEKVRINTETDLPRPEGILGLKGILNLEEAEVEDAERKALQEALLTSLDRAIAALLAARAEEGRRLASVLETELSEIEKLVVDARKVEAETLAQIKARVAQQVAELAEDTSISDERLAQEVALLALKADIREELDRLTGHIEAARELLASQDPIGRKLDFLTQEFNREVNTLCSKTPGLPLKRIGLALKAVVDQFREQIQNVE